MSTTKKSFFDLFREALDICKKIYESDSANVVFNPMPDGKYEIHFRNEVIITDLVDLKSYLAFVDIMPNLDELIDVSEFALLANVTPGTIRTYKSYGMLPKPRCYKSNSPLWDLNVVEKWIRERGIAVPMEKANTSEEI